MLVPGQSREKLMPDKQRTDKTKLYVLSNGFLENDVALNILLHNQANVDEPNKPAAWHRVPSISLLIEHPKLGWVLVDTGSHRDALNGRWPESVLKNVAIVRTEADLLENRLAEMGLKPSDIDLLILTHLHLENTGTIIYICDAANNRYNYGPPAKLSALLYNSDDFLRSIERVRWLQRRYDATVLFGHDLEQFNSLRLAPQCYD